MGKLGKPPVVPSNLGSRVGIYMLSSSDLRAGVDLYYYLTTLHYEVHTHIYIKSTVAAKQHVITFSHDRQGIDIREKGGFKVGPGSWQSLASKQAGRIPWEADPAWRLWAGGRMFNLDGTCHACMHTARGGGCRPVTFSIRQAALKRCF